MSARFFARLFLAGAVLLGGCGGKKRGDPGEDPNEAAPDGGGGGASAAGRYEAFLEVWSILNPVPTARQRCAACHSGNGPGRPAHSHDDPEVAYANARMVITPADPAVSPIVRQATRHVPEVGVQQFDAAELEKLLAWISLEATPDPGQEEPPPAIDPLLEQRRPQYALALNSVALRVAQVPAHLAELVDIDSQPTEDAQRATYERYVDLYLERNATPVEGALGLGSRRPGLVQNVFFNRDLWPGYPSPPPASERSDTFSLTRVDFFAGANRGLFYVYPSALSRLALQWVGFSGIRSSRDNPTILNQDNYGAVDALMRTVLEDRPVRHAFMTQPPGGATRACLHVPFSGYEEPAMHRQICRANAEVADASPSGAPVPGGIGGSRSFQRVEYGHYKYHTVRALFRKFHCKDFPIFTNGLVNGTDDAASRGRVVAPWNQVGTRPYCAMCHANSNLNVMALGFWRFEDATGVLRDTYVALRPTNQPVEGPTDILQPSVDVSRYYYKDQVLGSLDEWFQAFVADPDFTRCTAAQVYNFAMGRGNAAIPEYAVPTSKMEVLVAAYEAAYGAGSARDMTALGMLRVAFKSRDFTHR